MDMQTYSEMIHGIVVPATLSPEECSNVINHSLIFFKLKHQRDYIVSAGVMKEVFPPLTKTSCGFLLGTR